MKSVFNYFGCKSLDELVATCVISAIVIAFISAFFWTVLGWFAGIIAIIATPASAYHLHKLIDKIDKSEDC